MKYVENTLDEPRRVPTPDGRLHRVPPNSVRSLPDDAEIGGISGLEEVGESEWEDRQNKLSSERTPHHDRDDARAKARAYADSVATVVPLQQVVGDDDAPYGPPTGTITTKQTEAAKSSVEKERFADHEQLEVPEGASPVEQHQAERLQEVEKIAQEELSSGDGEEGGESTEDTTEAPPQAEAQQRSRKQTPRGPAGTGPTDPKPV